MLAAVSEAAPPDRWLGETLSGRYRIDAPLGQGGLGMVYRATHLGIDRPVAVKVLHPELLPNVGLRQRFEREVKTLSRLAHPHVVSLIDSGVLDDGSGYLVMELLEGESLEQRLRAGAMAPDQAIVIVRQILLALAEAHQKGVLHRDIKPANVFLLPLADGGTHVKLLDFGLAKVRSDMATDPGAFPTLTADGTVVGTPTYMAPEQAAAATADASSDVYSVGIVLFELLTGRPPFEGKTKLETIRAHLGQAVPELESVRPGLSPAPELAALVHKALAKDRLERYASAREMLSALDALPSPAARVLSGEAQTERPPAISGTEPTMSLRGSELATLDSVPSAKAKAGTSTPKTKTAPPAKTKIPALALPIALGAVALVGIIGGAWALWAGDEPVDPATDPDDPLVESDSTAVDGDGDASVALDPEAEAAIAEDSETDPSNPFNAGPIPDELRESRRRIFRGRWLDADQLRDVRRYQRAHPDDARSSLLLARHHRLQGEWAPAVRHYRAAHRIDAGSAAFRPMLHDLVRAARERTSATAAAQALEQIYGREALPAVERSIRSRGLDAAERRRLTRLRDRLSAL